MDGGEGYQAASGSVLHNEELPTRMPTAPCGEMLLFYKDCEL